MQYQSNLEIKNRIRRVKKTLPNLNNGRATQLPPLDGSGFKTSKRSFSVKQGNSVHGRTTEDAKMFSSSQRGVFGELNQSSATAIPINSMYDGEEERKAAIPPPLEEKVEEEEVIEETRREEVNEDVADSKEQVPDTQETAVKQEKTEPSMASPAQNTAKVETDVRKSDDESNKDEPESAVSEQKASVRDSVPAENMPPSESKAIPEENLPAEEYNPNEDEANFEGEAREGGSQASIREEIEDDE